jgi:hypothetical protein
MIHSKKVGAMEGRLNCRLHPLRGSGLLTMCSEPNPFQ